MREIWTIEKETGEPIGTANTLWSVATLLNKIDFLPLKDFNVKLACSDIDTFIKEMKLKHGIVLKKKRKIF